MEENPDQDPESFSIAVQVHSQPQTEQVQGTSTEPDQVSIEAETVSTELGYLDFRRQQLHHRRVLLLKMKQFRNRNGKREEESEESCELEDIQEELEKLVEREEQLLQRDSNTTVSEQNPQTGTSEDLIDVAHHTHPRSPKAHMGPPRGVCVLPPCATKEEVASEEVTSSIPEPEANEEFVEVVKLNRCPALVQCPSCEQVVTTETYSKVGGAAWTLCLMSTMIGCVAGCCLIPFCLENLRDVGHRCPQCQAQIHTFERL